MQSARFFSSPITRRLRPWFDRHGSKLWQPLLTLLILSVTIATIILSSVQRSVALEFTPPDRNAPGRVIIDGGGARFNTETTIDRNISPQSNPGRASHSQFSNFDLSVEGNRLLSVPGLECPLTALVPESNAGLTLTPYPRLFFHMPPSPGASVAFRLETEAGELVYATQFVPEERDGSYDIALPSTSNLPPLEVGVMYRWTFTIPEQDLTLSGGILRGEPSPGFAVLLSAANPIERVRLLARTGIWFDALAEAADLVRNDRDRADYKQLWDDLLESVDLDKIAERPLL